MTSIDDVLAHIPVDQLAARLGVDPATARAAVEQALPALLGGMHANTKDPAAAASLAGALGGHDPRLLEGGVDLADVDPADGDKIVGHVFGAQRDQVAGALGGMPGGVGQDLIAKVLPVIAPIVMSYLATQFLSHIGVGAGTSSSGGGSSASGSGPGSGLGGALGNGGLTDILGSILGAGHPDGGALGGLGGLGDVLGGLLGRGRR